MTDPAGINIEVGDQLVRVRRPLRPKSRAVAILISIVAALFIGLMLTVIISIAIWPGEAKLLEPIICTTERPEAIVVYDTYSPQPGETVTDFSLYCMGPRGDVTDHGWAKVFIYLTIFHTLLVFALFSLLGARARFKARRRAEPPGPGEPPEPPDTFRPPHPLITDA